MFITLSPSPKLTVFETLLQADESFDSCLRHQHRWKLPL